ncbi:amidohydrolase family protein [Thermoactinospora rubra]|uniref:amidohydrolase family protein n=1 Tax=Thermoactinospora rubra TaxID=1088767 RepID=UPI000A0F952E|nr:amidohydrolase family protein [Thermoactinospora rubra]
MRRTELLDVNAMIGRLPAEDVGDGGVAELRRTMERLRIGSALVAHSAAWRHDPAEGNRLLLEEIAGDERLLPCWVGLPDTCGEVGPGFVANAVASGVRAIRLYPHDHGFQLAGPDVAPLLEEMAEAGLPLLLDMDQTSWPEIEQVASARPELHVVVCRVGYRKLRELAGVLGRNANVHVDLSYLGSHLGLEWLVERFGTRSVLFGTGMPLRDPADAVTRLLWSELDDEAVRAVGAGSARELLRGAA